MTVLASCRPPRQPLFEPRAERALHPALIDIAHHLPGASRGCLAMADFQGPWGVPDLAALVARPANREVRQAAGVPPLLAEHDCRLVTYSNAWIELEELGRRARVTTGQVERRVSRLIRIGALERGPTGKLRSNPSIKPMGRLWALEAKVSDWRRGLAQAHRYRMWADASVLALGDTRASREAISRDARSLRIAVWISGRWLIRPQLAAPDRARRLWASEHAVAALWGGTPN